MPPPNHGPECRKKKCYPTTCKECGEKVYYYECTCGSKVFFEELGEDWPDHFCGVVAPPLIASDWKQKLRTLDLKNKIKPPTNHDIVVPFDLANSVEHDVASGLLAETQSDGIGGLILISTMANGRDLRYWDGECWAEFGDHDVLPMKYGSIAAIIRATNQVRSDMVRDRVISVAFWVNDESSFAIFAKYAILTRLRLRSLSDRCRRWEPGRINSNMVRCILCDNNIPKKEFERHVLGVHSNFSPDDWYNNLDDRDDLNGS